MSSIIRCNGRTIVQIDNVILNTLQINRFRYNDLRKQDSFSWDDVLDAMKRH